MVGPTYTTTVDLTAQDNEVSIAGITAVVTRITAASFLVGPQGPQGVAGAAGVQGVPGTDGVGIPIGGTTGQVLAKNSGTNYDTVFKTLAKSDVGLSNVPNTDATLRANHTGTQLASTISDFNTQVQANHLNQLASPSSDLSMSGWNWSALGHRRVIRTRPTKPMLMRTPVAAVPAKILHGA
jgi:hypothetical protein